MFENNECEVNPCMRLSISVKVYCAIMMYQNGISFTHLNEIVHDYYENIENDTKLFPLKA